MANWVDYNGEKLKLIVINFNRINTPNCIYAKVRHSENGIVVMEIDRRSVGIGTKYNVRDGKKIFIPYTSIFMLKEI